jgi:hypothetical protein
MPGGIRKHSGIFHATLHNVSIGNDCCIENIKNYIANYDIEEDCFIENCDIILVDGETSFGCGTEVSVLCETGGREVTIHDRLTAHEAYITAMYRHRPVLIQRIKDMVAAHTAKRTGNRGTISAHCTVVDTGYIKNVYVGPGCKIEGAGRLKNGSLMSRTDSPIHIGYGVIADDFIVQDGSSIEDCTTLTRCFVGQACTFKHGYSASDSLFFCNCHEENGEACSIFAGPFTVTHHKSTLLIGGAFSFYNAGSGTNQSNHAYKMGPIHWGTLDRGSKTASGSHILWPAHIGSFSMVMGKVQSHPQVQKLPFSYVIADGQDTWLVPGINLRTVGTWRDINKWPKRDVRPRESREDIINFAFPNPYIIQSVIEGKDILNNLQKSHPADTDIYEYQGCKIKRASLLKGVQYYELALKLFLHHCFQTNTAVTNDANGCRWIDMMGMLAPKSEIDSVVKDVRNGNISTLDELKEILRQIHLNYKQNEQSYANFVMQSCGNNLFIDHDHWMREAEEAYALWLKMVRDDAEKEFQMGDVEDQQLRDFLEKVK